MTARAGVFVAVRRVYALADPGRKRGAKVAVLNCNHARTTVGSVAPARMWCRLCTAAKATAKSRTEAKRYTATDIAAAVRKALAKAGWKDGVRT